MVLDRKIIGMRTYNRIEQLALAKAYATVFEPVLYKLVDESDIPDDVVFTHDYSTLQFSTKDKNLDIDFEVDPNGMLTCITYTVSDAMREEVSVRYCHGKLTNTFALPIGDLMQYAIDLFQTTMID